jgi:hypothetical protein
MSIALDKAASQTKKGCGKPQPFSRGMITKEE